MTTTTLAAITLLLQQSTIVSLVMGIFVLWRDKRINFFSILMIACAIWSFAYSNELAAATLDAKILWAQVEYIGIATVPALWFLYILQYTQHRDWINSRNIIFALVVPLITIISVWTNDAHKLFWTDSAIVQVGVLLNLDNSYGILFWIHTFYSYSIMLVGSFFLINYIFTYRSQSTGRIIVVLLATAAPWISNILFLSGMIQHIDTTPIAFTIVGILMGWAIYRMSDISVPIAYRVAIQALADGVALVNAEHIVTDVNQAMTKLIAKSPAQIVGQSANTLFSDALAFETTPTIRITTTQANDVEKYVKLQVSPVLHNNEVIAGYVIVAEDITLQKHTEEDMRYMLKQVETIKKEWETTADSLDQLICLVNESGMVLRSNLAVENWGLESVTRAKGQGLVSLLGRVYPDLANAIDSNWNDIFQALQQGFPYDMDVEDTQLGHFFEVRFEPLRQHTKAASSGSFAVASIYDVTKRKHLERDLERALNLAEREHKKSEALLLNILPKPIAERLKEGDSVIADSMDEVTVLFADIVGFTKLASRISATELVQRLNKIFSKFDELAFKHGLEKIKTLGDAYMVVGGLPLPKEDHAQAVALMALDMQEAIGDFADEFGEPISIRIGLHSGSVVAGVIGTKKFAYDLWGDTVNVASRMESHGIEGEIQVSEATYQYLQQDFELEERGMVHLKNKGEVLTYLLKGSKVAISEQN